MALSKSPQSGQLPMSCQMCEESNEIRWKCLLCDFLLCSKCQKLHKKVKSTDHHTIIDIKDIASHQQQTKDKLDFSNITCGIHAGQNCCLYCQSCEVVVCPLCIINIHDKHKMIELAQGYELTIKTVKTFNSEIDQKLVQNMKELSELGTFKSSEDSKYELEKQKILSRKKILKDEVEQHTNKLLKELDQRKEILMKSVNDTENRSEKIIKDLDLRKKNLSQAINSNIANQVFNIYSEEKTSRKQITDPVKTIFQKMPKFVPGKQVIQDFYLGGLQVSETDDDQKIFEFKLIKQYKTELPLVENLIWCGDAQIWISHLKSHQLTKLKLTNESISLHKMHTFKIDVYNMALLQSGDLLLSTMESNLKILPFSSSKVKPAKYRVNPLITLAVHVTRDYKILVGARENQPNSFPVNGPRQVITMNMDGRKENMYHINNKGQPIFTLPYRITTGNDNNIYVIDTLDEEGNGRIVALEKANAVRWIYLGNPDINKEKTLKPDNFVATKSDNIIIIDMDNDMIHILNTSGQCVHLMNTEDKLGIQCPYSLDIDNTGTLYIGCGRYVGEPMEAKIYTVQVSRF
ncbi:TRIM2_3 [Mytilus coruscus]|uniref:TRIM2_3 n=1 Tax=Mytilus coruscus TaxID=42192 RepID=A0A6J8EG55_MYTCO|nr:TRIM2_3 [Mytilus coruscus]